MKNFEQEEAKVVDQCNALGDVCHAQALAAHERSLRNDDEIVQHTMLCLAFIREFRMLKGVGDDGGDDD